MSAFSRDSSSSACCRTQSGSTSPYTCSSHPISPRRLALDSPPLLNSLPSQTCWNFRLLYTPIPGSRFCTDEHERGQKNERRNDVHLTLLFLRSAKESSSSTRAKTTHRILAKYPKPPFADPGDEMDGTCAANNRQNPITRKAGCQDGWWSNSSQLPG